MSLPQSISYTDLPYELPDTNAVYHSAFRRASAERIINQVSGPVATALRRAFAVNGSKTAWAIVIENDGQPMYVVQNMKYTLTLETQRRVLRVRLPLPEYLAPST
jgi:hypothetical protein